MNLLSIEKLYSLFLKHPIITTDSRNIPAGSIFFALKGETFNGNEFALQSIEAGASFALIDEEKYNLNDQCLLVQDCLKTLQQLATFHRKQIQTTVIGITGTNGKTTTKELINAVLSKKYRTYATKGNLNNHIGVPLSVLSIMPDTEFAVIEMGANHTGEIEKLCQIAQPDWGIITNIGKAHLEGFGSIEGVIKAKSELYQSILLQKKKIFINDDDPILKTISKNIDKIKYSISDMHSDCYGDLIECNPFVKLKTIINHNELIIQSQLIGSYNMMNILAAVCIGNYFGVESDAIQQAIEQYEPSNNRSQFLKTKNNQLILDAYNANPSSMDAAIRNFSTLPYENKYAIIGDMFELGNESLKEHIKIIDLLSKQKIKEVILIGKVFAALNSDFKTFDTVESAREWFISNPIINATILVKGSRGVKLEKLTVLL